MSILYVLMDLVSLFLLIHVLLKIDFIVCFRIISECSINIGFIALFMVERK